MTTNPMPLRSTRDLREVVSEEVRALMGRRRMNQTALAKVLGVSQAQVSSRLRGETPFTLADLQVLSDHFGVAPATLLGEVVATPQPPNPPTVASQRDELAALTARKRGRGAPTAE